MSDELPVAIVRDRASRRARISLIWAVPFVTLLVAGWLGWDTLSKRGPEITIRFDFASGLQPKQSRIRNRDVDLGTVEKVALSPDRRHVLVTARMSRESQSLLTDTAKFWVVKPRFFAGAVSGLETLISGSYIQLEPGTGGAPATGFVGLEDPPVLRSEVPGHSFQLKAARIGSLNPGSPILFRDLVVGEVLGWDIGEMATEVTIHAFVRAPYDRYVHDRTVFWNASGVAVNLGGSGVKLELESLRALVLGGVAFDSPDNVATAPMAAENHVFQLEPDRQTAKAAMFDRRLRFVSYFQTSASGLDVGSPVIIHGIRIGVVTDVRLRYQPDTEIIDVAVHYTFEPGRVSGLDMPADGVGMDGRMTDLVQRGLRVRLASASIVTGSKQLVLDLVPATPAAVLRKEGDEFVLPPIEGDQGDITASAGALVARLQTIPFEEIGDNLNKTLAGANGTINDPKLRQAIANLSSTLNTAHDFLNSVNKGVDPLLKGLPKMASNLDEAIKHANQLVASLDTGYGGGSQFGRDTGRLMLQLTDAARAVRILADLLARHPEALIRGRAEQEVR